MKKYFSTREVAKILSVRPDNLSRAIWLGRISQPAKSPSGNYLWTEKDITDSYSLQKYV